MHDEGLHNSYSAPNINKNKEIERKERKCIKSYGRNNLKASKHLKRLGVDGRKIL
jgi:hypothetical protein